MQEKDNTTNSYWENNERFADIVNVTIFEAKKVLTKECLEKAEREINQKFIMQCP